MRGKTLFVIVLTVLVTIVLMQNADEVKFKFLFWDLYLPKLVILTGVIFVGVVLGLLLASKSSRSRSNNNNDDDQDNNYRKPYDTLSPEDWDYISD